MKKLLIATSALVATAGVAAAQVSVTGEGRFGIQYLANTAPAGAPQYIVSNRVRVNFTMSGTADNGVTFGAFTRLNMQQGQNVGQAGANASRVSASQVFLAANGFRITVGNMDGAVARRVALYGGGLGFTGSFGIAGNFDAGGLSNGPIPPTPFVGGELNPYGAVMVPTTHSSYGEEGNGGNGATRVRIDADFGDFGASIAFTPNAANTTELAISYAAGGFTAAIGGRFGSTAAFGHNNQTSVSLGYRMGDIAVGALATNIANQTGSLYTGGTNWRLWGTYTTGPWTLRATVTQINASGWSADCTAAGNVGGANACGRNTGTAWGIGGSYNLGGGASASLAVGANPSNNAVAELGVNMRF